MGAEGNIKTMPKLSLNGLSRRFGATTAVDGVTLDLERGEFVSLLGPSGCGKTTTLRMIAGFMEPSEGTIDMDGKSLSTPQFALPPEKRGMSMIFQSYAIWPNMTVAENVAFGLQVRKMAKPEIETRVARILDVVQLGKLAGRYPAELSGGQQQRVALARAIVVEPEVLLLDEPLSNLDANLREEMRFEIRRLHDEFRITSVYVTHDQAEAMVTSDRIVVMNQGRIEQVATPFEVYHHPRTRFVAGFIGKTNLLDAARAGGDIVVGPWRWPLAALSTQPPAVAAFQVSIRPHDVRLNAGAPTGASAFELPGKVVQRAYLGDIWDYGVALGDGATTIRVSTPPRIVFETGAAVTCAIDPSAIALVE